MGFDDALNKAKDFAGDHKDESDKAIDGASQKAQDAAPDQLDGGIDKGATGLKDSIGGDK